MNEMNEYYTVGIHPPMFIWWYKRCSRSTRL